MVLSVRDVLTWVQFMNTTSSSLSAIQSFIHGAYLVFLDSLGCGAAPSHGAETKAAAAHQMRDVLQRHGLESCEEDGGVNGFCYDGEMCGMPPFMIARGIFFLCEISVNICKMASL